MTKPYFVNPLNEDGRRPQNIKSGISQQPLIGSYSNFKLRVRRSQQSVKILQMKTTSHKRRPQNIKSGIYQEPLIGSYSNFRLKLRLPKKNITNPSMEDDLKISKGEYLSNHFMDRDL